MMSRSPSGERGKSKGGDLEEGGWGGGLREVDDISHILGQGGQKQGEGI